MIALEGLHEWPFCQLDVFEAHGVSLGASTNRTAELILPGLANEVKVFLKAVQVLSRLLNAAPEADERQLRLEASQLEALCVKKGLRREVVQHVHLLHQFGALMSRAPPSVGDLRAFSCMLPLNSAGLHNTICQVR